MALGCPFVLPYLGDMLITACHKK